MHILIVFSYVFRIESINELKKLPVHGLVVGLVVEPRLNRWHHKYIIYILLKLKNINIDKIKNQ